MHTVIILWQLKDSLKEENLGYNLGPKEENLGYNLGPYIERPISGTDP
jgi:hypothetical protein